ncbi:hypothetical protein MF271_19870 (plasmid) [Deinococcus sp. KNUC1210]|nr:hypothetical protein [Deinococcus sp. KNUC1210]ULH17672.1 hypothetical protein MF271_19870 [Deinococcus sp. KNUC1210]
MMVHHLPALARVADRMLVMDHGRVVEGGQHAQLMAAGEQYFQPFTR